MRTWSGLWIALHDGLWFVGIQSGYYNQPLEKAAAVRRARELRGAQARASGTRGPIRVFGEDEQLIEQIA